MTDATQGEAVPFAPRQRAAMPAPAPREIWWISPKWCLLGLILPIYVISEILGGPMMGDFGSSNFLSRQMIALGAASIFALVLGSLFGERIADGAGFKDNVIDAERLDRALVVAGVARTF